jgi:hypothetical protein
MVKLEGLLVVIGLAVTLFAFVDCAMREDIQLKSLPKWGWLLAIFLTGVFGSIAYLIVGRNGSRTPGVRKPKSKPRILPPDDDPDFLRKL